jgi:hypothetical protein
MICIEDKQECARVGLFGISRSGKNYTIDEFIRIARENGVEFIHMSPMDMIRERLGGRKLSTMTESEKKTLVKQVRDEIDEVAKDHNVIVDEHYCYPVSFGGVKPENGYYNEKLPHDIWHREIAKVDYEVVFPRFEYMKYDLLAVMDVDPEIIVERCRTSEGSKYNPYITAEEAREWGYTEKAGICIESHMDVYFIDDPKRSGEQLWKWYNHDKFMKLIEGITESTEIHMVKSGNSDDGRKD